MRTLAEMEDSLLRQAQESLEVLNSTEIRNWQAHPCTQFVLKKMAAEVLSYHINWQSGAFTEESEDGTIQKNASALGAMGALAAITEDIEQMADLLAS